MSKSIVVQYNYLAHVALDLYPDPHIPWHWMYCITSTQKDWSVNSCTDFVCSRGICMEPMGCQLSHERPHIRNVECPSKLSTHIAVLCSAFYGEGVAMPDYSEL